MKMFKVITNLIACTVLFSLQAQVKDLPDFLVVWKAYLASPDRTAVDNVVATYDALLPYKQRVASERMRTDLGVTIRELRAIQTARRGGVQVADEETRQALEQAVKDIEAREEEVRKSREAAQQKQEEIDRLQRELEALKKLQQQPGGEPVPVAPLFEPNREINYVADSFDGLAEFKQEVLRLEYLAKIKLIDDLKEQAYRALVLNEMRKYVRRAYVGNDEEGVYTSYPYDERNKDIKRAVDIIKKQDSTFEASFDAARKQLDARLAYVLDKSVLEKFPKDSHELATYLTFVQRTALTLSPFNKLSDAAKKTALESIDSDIGAASVNLSAVQADAVAKLEDWVAGNPIPLSGGVVIAESDFKPLVDYKLNASDYDVKEAVLRKQVEAQLSAYKVSPSDAVKKQLLSDLYTIAIMHEIRRNIEPYFGLSKSTWTPGVSYFDWSDDWIKGQIKLLPVADRNLFDARWQQLEQKIKVYLSPQVLGFITGNVKKINMVKSEYALTNYLEWVENDARANSPYGRPADLKDVSLDAWISRVLSPQEGQRFRTALSEAEKVVVPSKGKTPQELEQLLTDPSTEGKALIDAANAYKDAVPLANRAAVIDEVKNRVLTAYKASSAATKDPVKAEKLAYAYEAYKILGEKKPIASMCNFLQSNFPRVLDDHPLLCQDEPAVVVPPKPAGATPAEKVDEALRNLQDLSKPNRTTLGDALLVAVNEYKPQSSGTSDSKVQELLTIFETTRGNKDDKTKFSYEDRKKLNVNVIYLLAALDKFGITVDDTAGKDVCSLWRKPTHSGILASEIDVVCLKYNV